MRSFEDQLRDSDEKKRYRERSPSDGAAAGELLASRWRKVALFLVLLVVLGAASYEWERARQRSTSTQAAEDDRARATRELYYIIEHDWEWVKRDRPELATRAGDHRYDELLTRHSLAAEAARAAHAKNVQQQLARLQHDALRHSDHVTWAIHLNSKTREVDAYAYRLHLLPLSPTHGIHMAWPRLAREMPLRDATQLARWLQRLTALEQQVLDVIELLREGVRRNVTLPHVCVAEGGLVRQIDALHDGVRAEQSVFFAPYARWRQAMPLGDDGGDFNGGWAETN